MGAQFIPDRVSDLSDWLQSSFVDASVVAWDAAAGRFRAAVEGVSYISPQVNHDNPTWISSLAGSKVAGNITGNAASITGAVPTAQVTGLDAALAGKAATVHQHSGIDINSGIVSATYLPIMGASGAGHAPGIVSDPGAVAGTTRFLCEDSTWKTPPSGGTAAAAGPSGSGAIQYNGTGGIFDANTNFAYMNSQMTLTASCDGFAVGPIIAKSVGNASAGTALTLDSTSHTNGKKYNFISTGTGASGGAGDFAVYESVTGRYCFRANSSGQIIVGWNKFGYYGQITSYPDPTTVGITVLGDAAQSADLFRVFLSGGGITFGLDHHGRIYTGSTVATIAPGPGAGTGPAVSVAGNDTAGNIAVTTGTAPAASAVVATISFSVPRTVAPKIVVLQPADASTAALYGPGAVWAFSAGYTTAKFDISVGSTALAPSKLHRWTYLVVG